MRTTRLALIAFLMALAAPAAALAPAARGAVTAVNSFHAALRRGDTASAAELLATDAVIFEEGEVERTKAEYAAHHLSADAVFAQAMRSIVTRRAGQSAGPLAWIASEGRTTGTYKGKPVDRITTETMVLRRGPGGWKIVHVHWSSAAAN